jgi:hypothetical protein
MVNRPDLRIGDTDREEGAASLREHYAQGRLSLEEFHERLDAVFAATTQGQLDRVTSDLPHVRTPSAPLPTAASGTADERADARGRLGMVAVLVGFLAIWLLMLIPTLSHPGSSAAGRFPLLLIGLLVIRVLGFRIFGGRSRMDDQSGPTRRLEDDWRHHHHHHHRDGRPW